jgi:microcystin-dependent protein
MAQPFLGEIRALGFNYPPKGWAFCNGQTLAISQNQALFSILGTTYGGDGAVTFKLPNLQGAVPVHTGQGIALGQVGGSAGVTLNINQTPHSHPAGAVNATANQPLPVGNLPGNANAQSQYGTGINTSLNSAVITPTGGGTAHNNMQPSLVVNFAIALQGIFPSRN